MTTELNLYGGEMQFTQEGNCMDSASFETIDVSVKDGGAGKFFVIKSEQWSLDKPEDILILLKKVETAFCENNNDLKESDNGK